MNGNLLTPKEAARKLGVSIDTLDGLVADGELVFVNVSRGKKKVRRRFDEADIDAFIKLRKQRKTPPRTTSTKTKRATISPPKSGSTVTSFLARRAARAAAKQISTPKS